MARTVILGAGIAGHTAALHLRRQRGREQRAGRADARSWPQMQPHQQPALSLSWLIGLSVGFPLGEGQWQDATAACLSVEIRGSYTFQGLVRCLVVLHDACGCTKDMPLQCSG